MKKNISKFINCYGCGVCVSVCPIKIIGFKENKEGFYSPYIDNQDKCIDCGLCLKVCAFNYEEIDEREDKEFKAYSAHSNNEVVRQRCSSGGIGFEVARFLIEKGYKACGVKYNVKKRRAEHFIAETIEEFYPSIGSKYIPSFTAEAFSKINKIDKYFVSGTPCQIDSFRRFIKHLKIEDNFVLLDFFCHGVPSLLIWDKYIFDVEQEIGDVTFVSWRNKTTGWHDSWVVCADTTIDWHQSNNLKIKEKKHLYQSWFTQGDLFYKFFLGNYCLNMCCYHNCKYKMGNSAADIRIGDLWGRTFAQENKGTNAVITFTEIGDWVISEINGCTFERIDPKIAMEGQMQYSPEQPLIYKNVIRQLQSSLSLKEIFNTLIRGYRLFILPKRIWNKLYRKWVKR